MRIEQNENFYKIILFSFLSFFFRGGEQESGGTTVT